MSVQDERGFGEGGKPLQTKSISAPTPSRYRWSWRGVNFDYYRLCEILKLTNDAQKHALKKIIRAGQSVKPITQDIEEAIDALQRWKQMVEEDSHAASGQKGKY